ncbi:phage antirepressor KilAC domain-containing protein [Acinetobacter oleivorans]|uniref:phage antirepressor KilAC domain-containing protein n=1 Tax=Acinetobacter oleivorans TaxID=1148157 RepID=UPI00157FF2E1|nr:phage antirepressor KilAC domain-containing protein [Acinetobacter oleivorans]NUF13684.1 Rha family transcriptional regulator [Acinetobacter oleivorans]
MTNLNINLKNAVAINSKTVVASMSSQDIAELVQARHDNVKTSIERLIASEVIVQPAMKDEQTFDALGRSRTTQVYVFEGEQGKRDSTIVVAQLSPQFTAKLVDRWIELESQAKQHFQLPTTFSQALLLAAQLEEQKEQLALQVAQQQQVIEHQQPTVDAYELLAGKKGSMCFQDAYKFLGGMKQKDMKEWMVAKGWIYIDRFNRVSASNTYLVNGYLKVKATTHAPQIRITYKGLAAMARQMKIKINAEDLEG